MFVGALMGVKRGPAFVSLSRSLHLLAISSIIFPNLLNPGPAFRRLEEDGCIEASCFGGAWLFDPCFDGNPLGDLLRFGFFLVLRL
jgi:hypothetical protein